MRGVCLACSTCPVSTYKRPNQTDASYWSYAPPVLRSKTRLLRATTNVWCRFIAIQTSKEVKPGVRAGVGLSEKFDQIVDVLLLFLEGVPCRRAVTGIFLHRSSLLASTCVLPSTVRSRADCTRRGAPWGNLRMGCETFAAHDK